MSGKKQQRMMKILDKRERREEGRDVNPNKKVHAGEVQYLLTSHMSKAVGCTLPETGHGQLMRKQTGNTMRAGSGEVALIHFPPPPVKAVALQQVKKLSKRFSFPSLELDSQHPLLEERKLPMIPAGYGNKRERPMPVRLPPIENMTLSSSSSAWSAGHKPEMVALGPTMELHSTWKLPDIKRAPAKCSRPKSDTLQRLSRVLPPISRRTEELRKNHKLSYWQTCSGLRVPQQT
ncbi:uncharacterized protein [Trachinotus anak]|uniref:uncharacterized protein n=1 Tax=Trachinotus anak TaxID=443729 RepID=UPI0039F16A83